MLCLNEVVLVVLLWCKNSNKKIRLAVVFFVYKEIAFKSEKNKNDTNITKHYPKRNKQSFKF